MLPDFPGIGRGGSDMFNATLSAIAMAAVFTSTQALAQTDLTVTCFLSLGGTAGGGSPFSGGAVTSAPISALQCPTGVTAIDVQRVLYDPYGIAGGATPSVNVANYTMVIAVAPAGQPSFIGTDAQILAMVSNGAPEKSLSQPVRLDKNTRNILVESLSCSSGVVGFNAACGGVVYFIGTSAFSELRRP
jgi:hypothetical protein